MGRRRYRRRRLSRRETIDASELLLLLPGEDGIAARLAKDGFRLDPVARLMRRRDGSFSARLIWRRGDEETVVYVVRPLRLSEAG